MYIYSKFKKICVKVFGRKIFMLKDFCIMGKFNSHSITYYVCWKYFVRLVFVPFIGEYNNFLTTKILQFYLVLKLVSNLMHLCSKIVRNHMDFWYIQHCAQ